MTSVVGIAQNLMILGACFYYSADDVRRVADGMRDKSKDSIYGTQTKEIYEILIDNVRDCELIV
jgi:hypothetical protein